jgi:formiminotetrahydrofolate cyclodeaminase
MAAQEPADGAQHPASFSLGDQSFVALLEQFAAGNEVPGSGSANALASAVATCLTTSVAVKTQKSPGTKYLHVQQTARDVQRRARRTATQLLELFDRDSAAFAPVIAIRRTTGRADDPIVQDASLRQEVAALKPATEIPLQIGRLAIETAELAVTMLDSGFVAARGESYTALAQAIAAIDGSLFVAQMNIRTVRQRIARLNDPQLEAAWITRVLRDIMEIRDRWRELRVREQLARRALETETFQTAEMAQD